MTNASVLVEALAEPTRREIVERLVEQPSSVTEIARTMPISRSAVSQHLQVLKSVGLVIDRAEGTRRVYRVDPAALAIIRAYFDAFWQRSLVAFQDAAEPPRGARPQRDSSRNSLKAPATDKEER
jgi:DNA-binding transcriptional ArsR family regulator